MLCVLFYLMYKHNSIQIINISLTRFKMGLFEFEYDLDNLISDMGRIVRFGSVYQVKGGALNFFSQKG